MAGPSRSLITGTPRDTFPEIKKVVNEQVKQARKEIKAEDKFDAAVSATMEWVPLPQRFPKPSLPRVVANVQLVPLRDAGIPLKKRKVSTPGKRENYEEPKEGPKSEKTADWNVVPNKNSRSKGRKEGRANMTRRDSKPSLPKSGETIPRRKPKGPVRVPPRTVAVSITDRSENFSYKKALTKARNEISLKELKIESTRLRRTANGGYLIEIMDKDSAGKAKALRERLKALLPEEQATVACPVTYDELRFVGLDDTILPEEVAQFVASEGKCEEEDIKIGRIQPMRDGLNTIWARCPISAATVIASKKKVRMGWTYVKVELLRARPMQCYKCWSFGHVRYSCTSIINRSRSCFNCGGEGHALRDCQLPPRCVVCEAEGEKW